MNTLIIFTAEYLFAIVALLALYAWTRLSGRLRLQAAVAAGLGLLLAVVLVKVAGALHPDVRPFVAHHFTPLIAQSGDNGFPSDHTTFTMLAAFILWPYARRWSAVLAVLAFLVGSARVAAGVHSWQDIVGGIVVAALAAGGAYYGARWIVKIPRNQSQTT